MEVPLSESRAAVAAQWESREGIYCASLSPTNAVMVVHHMDCPFISRYIANPRKWVVFASPAQVMRDYKSLNFANTAPCTVCITDEQERRMLSTVRSNHRRSA